MYKLVLLFLCINLALGTISNGNKRGSKRTCRSQKWPLPPMDKCNQLRCGMRRGDCLCSDPVTCDDCMPIAKCEGASGYMQKTKENLQYIAKFCCGITETVNVCCSKFKSEHPNLKLLPDSCGNIYNAINFRITAGSFASLFEFPWMVLISYKTADDFKFRCSGTLINSRYVLTAAHCVHNFDIAGVRVGEYEIGKAIDCDDNVCETNTIQDIKIEQAIPHEDYNPFEHHSNDIALLRLATSVDMSFRNTGTICLPITKELQNRSITNQYATVAGWGYTEHRRDSTLLLKVLLPVRTKEDCEHYYSHMSNVEQTQFCAGTRNRDSCDGDSGGPLMLEDIYKGEPKYVQYGIVSSGPIKCGSDRPGIYTDVRKYSNWILDHMKE